MMKRTFTTMAAAGWALWGLALALPASAQQSSVTVDLSPKQIRLGNAARLTVQIENGRNSQVFLPKVNDLIIRYRGEDANQQRISIINGQMTFQSSRILVYNVIPYKEGNYTIPAFEVDVDGQVFKTPELKLQVLPGQAPAAQSQTPNPPRRAQPAVPGVAVPSAPSASGGGFSNLAPYRGQGPSAPRTPTAPAAAPSQPNVAPNSPGRLRREWAFIELEMPKKEVYVGEMLPVRIKFYVKQEARASYYSPLVPSEAFVINKLAEKPQERSEYVGGEVYRVMTWDTGLTAVKEGKYTVDASIETELAVPVAASPRDPFAGFGRRFFNRVRRFEKTLASVPVEVMIKPLPTDGRPATFDGAVGEFDLSAKAKPDTVDLGEPLTLITEVNGQGNLDRVNTPTMVDETGWRVYPATSDVVLSDESGVRGKKLFEQAIVPREPGITGIPEIEFSFFNPNTGKYVTKRINGPEVRIIGSPQQAPSTQPTVTAGTEPSAPVLSEEDSLLVPIKTQFGGFTTNFSRVALQPWFLAVNSLPLLALVMGFAVVSRKRRLENDPVFARTVRLSRELTAEQGKMNTAVSSNDTEAFFAAARSAIQFRLALQTEIEPADVTAETVTEHVPEAAEAATEIFSQADAMTYGGGASSRPLGEWKGLVDATLVQMEQTGQTKTEVTS